MITGEENYSKETTEELIGNYKDLIKKTFEVTDKDLLQEKIDSENSEESEEKYLNAIKKRRVALDEVDTMLEKIIKLELRVTGAAETEEKQKQNRAKRLAQESK